MSMVIDYKPQGKVGRHQRWERRPRAELLRQSRDFQAQGLSQRPAATRLQVPRPPRQAWRAWQDRLDACPPVGEFFASVPGLACLHRLGRAFHGGCVAIGTGGMRLGGLWVEMTGRKRWVGAAYGTQPQGNRHVAEAIVAYKREETICLAQAMPPQEITAPQEEILTGGLGLGAIEPVSNSILLEQPAAARDHATWHALMVDALAWRKGTVIQSTSDEAPGLLAYVDEHLRAHHAPDLCHVQHELRKARAVPMAAKQRAAHQAVAQAEEDAAAGARAP